MVWRQTADNEEAKRGEVAANAQFSDLVKKDNIVKQGYLQKRSRYLSQWKKRFVVLTKDHLLTFANNTNLTQPTEVIKMEICCTVKSSDDETNKQNSFVRISTILTHFKIYFSLSIFAPFYNQFFIELPLLET